MSPLPSQLKQNTSVDQQSRNSGLLASQIQQGFTAGRDENPKIDDVLGAEPPENRKETTKQREKVWSEQIFPSVSGLYKDVTVGNKFFSPTPEDFISSNKIQGEMASQLAEDIREGKVSEDQVDNIKKIMGKKDLADESKTEEILTKSDRQVVGDVLGTATWMLPGLGVSKGSILGLKGLSRTSKLKGATKLIGRGGAFGGTELAAMGLSEGADNETVAKRFAQGIALGAGAEVAGPVAFKAARKSLDGLAKSAQKVGRVSRKQVPKAFPESVRGAADDFKKFFTSVDGVFSSLGNYGREVARKLHTAKNASFRKASQWMTRLSDSGFENLNFNERLALQDAAEGRIARKDLTPKVRQVFDEYDGIRKEIDQQMKKVGAKIVRRDGSKTKWRGRKNFFPHVVPSLDALQNKEVFNRVVDDAVRRGRFPNRLEAETALDDYIQFASSNGKKRGDVIANRLVKEGKAKDLQEAKGMLRQFIERPRKAPSRVQKAREIDFPFWEPDPAKVMQTYLADAADVIEDTRAFGPGRRDFAKKIQQIRDEVDTNFSQKGAERAKRQLDKVDKALKGEFEDFGPEEAIRTIREVNNLQLAFAQMLNIAQNLNTFLATDLPSVAKGLRLFFTDEGKRRAFQTGALMDNLLRQSATLGKESGFSQRFLKVTGFTGVERFNRTVAANAGIEYSQRLRKQLLKNPDSKFIRRQMQEMGLDPEKALQRPFTEEELLTAGQNKAFQTQFRSSELDMPWFTQSPMGRLGFQFRNFAFNQARFLKNRLGGQLADGEYGKLYRDLAILGTAFPMTGEVVADLRSAVTGTSRPSDPLQRYWENFTSVGGMGIFADMIRSARWGDVSGFIIGPSARWGEAVSSVVQAATGDKWSNRDWQTALSLPGVTRPIAERAFPTDSPGRNTFLQELDSILSRTSGFTDFQSEVKKSSPPDEVKLDEETEKALRDAFEKEPLGEMPKVNIEEEQSDNEKSVSFQGMEVRIPRSVPGQAEAQLAFENNNPGNLKFAGQEKATRGEGGFAKFPNAAWGWEALRDQIELDRQRDLTLRSFVEKFAPATENDVDVYTNSLTSQLGVEANAKLSNVPIQDLAQAVAWQESHTKVKET